MKHLRAVWEHPMFALSRDIAIIFDRSLMLARRLPFYRTGGARNDEQHERCPEAGGRALALAPGDRV